MGNQGNQGDQQRAWQQYQDTGSWDWNGQRRVPQSFGGGYGGGMGGPTANPPGWNPGVGWSQDMKGRPGGGYANPPQWGGGYGGGWGGGGGIQADNWFETAMKDPAYRARLEASGNAGYNPYQNPNYRGQQMGIPPGMSQVEYWRNRPYDMYNGRHPFGSQGGNPTQGTGGISSQPMPRVGGQQVDLGGPLQGHPFLGSANQGMGRIGGRLSQATGGNSQRRHAGGSGGTARRMPNGQTPPIIPQNNTVSQNY